MYLTLNQLDDEIECLSRGKHTVPQLILRQFMAERLPGMGTAGHSPPLAVSDAVNIIS